MDLGFKTLPLELILSCILPKLPAKSLLRFKCVSKSFLAEISSPEFNALFSKANRLLIIPGDEVKTFCVYELDSPNSPPMVCPYPIASEWFAPVATMVAYCESHLLIGCGKVRPNPLILLNPTTRIYLIIPPTAYLGDWSDHVEYGMCHFSDEFNNDDFKIVRFSQYNDPNTDNSLREVTVYSLRSNSWKIIESEKPTTEFIRNPILVQNHLLVMAFEDCYYRCLMRIGCFDIKAERWSNDVVLSDILLGEIDPNPPRYGHYYLGVLEGQLRFSCYDMTKWTYSVWVMKDFGVKESWFKLMSVPGQGPEGICHPIAYRKGSLHELLCMPDYRGKYLWYNLRDKQFTETGLDDYGLNRNVRGFAFIYKESLLNFPGGQLIRSSSKLQEEEEEDNVDDGQLIRFC